MPDVNALSMLTSQKRGATVNALEVKTVGTRGRTRRARGGAATHLERSLYTPHRSSKQIGLIGSDQPFNEAARELEIFFGSTKLENPPWTSSIPEMNATIWC